MVDAEGKKGLQTNTLRCRFSNGASHQYANREFVSIFRSGRFSSITFNAGFTVDAD
jgi:hypothetical protein